jgi:uncharacterized protein with PIN domain
VRLLLDEQLSADIAEALRRHGHDVVAVQDAQRQDWRGLADADLFEIAQSEGRVLVTENVPHFRACADRFYAEGRGYHGLIYTSNKALPRHRHDEFVREVTARLHQLLRRNPGVKVASAETFL